MAKENVEAKVVVGVSMRRREWPGEGTPRPKSHLDRISHKVKDWFLKA